MLNAENVVLRRFVQIGERVDDLRVIEEGLDAEEWVIDGNGWPLVGSKLPDDLILIKQQVR